MDKIIIKIFSIRQLFTFMYFKFKHVSYQLDNLSDIELNFFSN